LLHLQQNQQRQLSPKLQPSDLTIRRPASVPALDNMNRINKPSCRKIAPSQFGRAVREKITACDRQAVLQFD
jgi:hypothetical protein